MTYDDYQQIRSQYEAIDELCRSVENAQMGVASEGNLRQLVQLLRDQQRAPEQIRSFARHLGAANEVINRSLADPQ